MFKGIWPEVPWTICHIIFNTCKSVRRHVFSISKAKNPEENIILTGPGQYYTFITCWWGKYENLFTQEYHIPLGQHPRGIWYSCLNTFSYFLNPYAINVLLYRMKPRKHIYLKYCWQAYFKSIETLSQTFKNHIHNKWCASRTSDVFLSKNDDSGGKTTRLPRGWNMIFISRNMILVLCDHVFWFLPNVQSN